MPTSPSDAADNALNEVIRLGVGIFLEFVLGFRFIVGVVLLLHEVQAVGDYAQTFGGKLR